MSVSRARPVAVGLATFVAGAVVACVLWMTAITLIVVTDDATPVGAVVLLWAGFVVLVVAAAATAVIVRRPLTELLHRAWRSLTDLEDQVDRTRNQIESRLDLQQRSIERLAARDSDSQPAASAHEPGWSTITRRPPKNVFVLGTGRCGTLTFSTACSHFDNYTSAHESLRGELSAARFGYPDDHIEVDNRLSWFTGGLARHFDDDETLYVHLTREPELVIDSYTRRWDSGFRSNIGRAFGHGIVVRTQDWPASDIRSVVRFYVETVTENLELFLEGRQAMAMQLEHLTDQFPDFVDRIGATGDIDAALADLSIRHNAARPDESDADPDAVAPGH